jgi:DMSO/TMAO reductase YedYZ molybdopterin-dependent catalytic subunit
VTEFVTSGEDANLMYRREGSSRGVGLAVVRFHLSRDRMETHTTESRAKSLSRRELLKLSPVLALGAFAVPKWREPLLAKGLALTDWAEEKTFRRNHLAPTYPDSAVAPLSTFYVNSYDVDDPGVDLAQWKLTVAGEVDKPGDYALAQIMALPKQQQNTRHVCVEGWDIIGNFGGARISDFLQTVGAHPDAKFVYVDCADDYYESVDMPTALHPQSLLCYEMYGQPLTRGHGAPLRLRLPTKVGYKSAKYITSLRVTSVLTQVGYWEDQGYSSYYGL